MHVTANRKTRRSAFTLIEVMTAMSILTIAGIGLLGTFLQTQKMTEGSIYHNTATTLAQGYIEQIKSMEFSSLDLASLPTMINQGVADPLVTSPSVYDPVAGAGTDIINTKLVDILNTPDDATDDLAVSIVIYVDDITDEAAGLGEARRIVLRYSFNIGVMNQQTTYSNILFTVRSEIPTF